MILLTFNIVNNLPLKKDGSFCSREELNDVTEKNVSAILRILDLQQIRCTFFVEVSLVHPLQILLKKISSKGHEISLFNQNSSLEEIDEAKHFLQNFLEKDVRGIRQLTSSVDSEELKRLEFTYISDIENADILFPFKRLTKQTEILEKNGVSIVPESISPYFQLPYNDYIFQILPVGYYKNMVFETLKADEFVLIYLNTWQLTDVKKLNLKMPFYRKINAGRSMEDKLDSFLKWVNDKEVATSRMKDYIL